jgi:hypothetical protein
VAQLSFVALAQLVTRRRFQGVLRAIPFEHGGPERPRDAGRRALAQALGSFAPNTIVVGIDPETNLMLAHQLRRSGGADMIDVLDLR